MHGWRELRPRELLLFPIGNRVIFVNSISMGLPSLRNKDLLPRIFRKLRSYARLARATPEGVTVVSPAVIPFFGSRAARTVNRKLLAMQIGRLARHGCQRTE